MSDEINPNPRGFVIEGVTFFDLGRIELVFRNRDTRVSIFYLVDREKPINITLSDENHAALLKALEIYRSNR